MDELIEWLNQNKISFKQIDRDVVEVDGFGKMFLNDLEELSSIFKTHGADKETQFNLTEDANILMAEGINYAVFRFGNNWYYTDLREEFKFNILKYIGTRQNTNIKTQFVNLGIHTPYELLNGSGGIDLWVKKAKYLGHTAIGVCDYNTMASSLILQKECGNAGLQHIFGYSFTMSCYDDLIDLKIYALNQVGLQNMLRVQKEIMVDSEDKTLTLQQVLSHGDGCAIVFGKLSAHWMSNNRSIVTSIIGAYEQVYYQVDLSEYKAERIDIAVLQSTQKFFDCFYSKENKLFGVPPILICDNYYLDKDDAKNKLLLNKISSGAAHNQSDDQYFKDVDEHYSIISQLFDPAEWDIDWLFDLMCAGTVNIAEAANASYDMTRNYMPQYDMTEEEKSKYKDRYAMFSQLLEEGLKKLVPPSKIKDYKDRLEFEKYILESTNNVDYILVQYDTVNWARSQGIMVGAGRGSAGGSLVLYLLGITLVDPIKYDLIFERFLLPERGGLYPDKVTKLASKIESSSYVEVKVGDKTYQFDNDAQLLIQRGDDKITVYADELQAGDDIIFDNKALIWDL